MTESTLEGHTHSVECVAFVQSRIAGLLLVTASWDHDLRIFSCTTNQCLKTLQGHGGWITCLAVRPGKIVSGALDKTVQVWALDLDTITEPAAGDLAQTRRVLEHPADVTACCFVGAGVERWRCIKHRRCTCWQAW
jgi:WD40 repeat protein